MGFGVVIHSLQGVALFLRGTDRRKRERASERYYFWKEAAEEEYPFFASAYRAAGAKRHFLAWRCNLLSGLERRVIDEMGWVGNLDRFGM
jgi:hypothetical protein